MGLAMIRSRIELPIDAIAQVCRRFGVARLAIFGSALRDDFHAGSDVDFLVRFANDDYGPWMSKLTELEQGLKALLNRHVDVASWPGIEQSQNSVRRKAILDSAQVVYEE